MLCVHAVLVCIYKITAPLCDIDFSHSFIMITAFIPGKKKSALQRV